MFNPKYTQESLAEEFVKNPEIAWRDFGAIPPLAMAPWISDVKAVINCVRQVPDPNYLTYRTRTETNNFGDSTIWFELDKVNLAGAGRLITIDNGLTNNAFGCCIGSLLPGNKVRIDAAFMLKPTTGSKINLDKMFTDFVQPLAKKIGAVAVIYDHWNSIQNVQNLRDTGTDARQHTLTAHNFAALKSAIFSQTISLPFTEFPLNSLLDRSSDTDLVSTSQDKPHFSLVLQTLTVREIGGGKVVKPKYGDDDVFRTMALAHAFCVDPEMMVLLQRGGLGQGQAGPRRAIGAISHMKSGSSMASGSASGKVNSFMHVRTRGRG